LVFQGKRYDRRGHKAPPERKESLFSDKRRRGVKREGPICILPMQRQGKKTSRIERAVRSLCLGSTLHGRKREKKGSRHKSRLGKKRGLHVLRLYFESPRKEKGAAMHIKKHERPFGRPRKKKKGEKKKRGEGGGMVPISPRTPSGKGDSTCPGACNCVTEKKGGKKRGEGKGKLSYGSSTKSYVLFLPCPWRLEGGDTLPPTTLSTSTRG